jgi:Tol biopolymer transport system component
MIRRVAPASRLSACAGKVASSINATYNKFEGFGGLAGDVSSDGKWVVYSNQGGKNGIWKVSIEGGEPIRLTGVEAADPTVSPDGKMIAYSFRDPSTNPPERFAIPCEALQSCHLQVVRP